MALGTGGVKQGHPGPQGNAVETNLYLGVPAAQEGHPAVHILNIVDTPIRMGAITFPMASQVRHQHVVAQVTVNGGVAQAHGPVLEQAVEQDDCPVALGIVFYIGAPELGAVLGGNDHLLPAVAGFGPVDLVQVIPVVFHPQNLVPGGAKKLVIGRISGVQPGSQKEQQAKIDYITDKIPNKTHGAAIPEYTDTILPCARTFFTTLPQLFDHPSGSICHPAQ